MSLISRLTRWYIAALSFSSGVILALEQGRPVGKGGGMEGEVEVLDGRVGVQEALRLLGEFLGTLGGVSNRTSAECSASSPVPIV